MASWTDPMEVCAADEPTAGAVVDANLEDGAALSAGPVIGKARQRPCVDPAMDGCLLDRHESARIMPHPQRFGFLLDCFGIPEVALGRGRGQSGNRAPRRTCLRSCA